MSANGDDCSSARHQTQYGYDCQLVTVGSRPAPVNALYAAGDCNMAPLVAQCDAFRNDGLPGAMIYSPCPTSTRWIDDHVDEDSVVRDKPVSAVIVCVLNEVGHLIVNILKTCRSLNYAVNCFRKLNDFYRFQQMFHVSVNY